MLTEACSVAMTFLNDFESKWTTGWPYMPASVVGAKAATSSRRLLTIMMYLCCPTTCTESQPVLRTGDGTDALTDACKQEVDRQRGGNPATKRHKSVPDLGEMI